MTRGMPLRHIKATHSELPAVGEYRVHTLLGSDAVYRVAATGPETTLVEVADAPGLRPGMQFKFLTAAVAEMPVVRELEHERSDAIYQQLLAA
jgi:hypothetical protein